MTLTKLDLTIKLGSVHANARHIVRALHLFYSSLQIIEVVVIGVSWILSQSGTESLS